MAPTKPSVPRLSKYKSKPKNHRQFRGSGVEWKPVPRAKPQTKNPRLLKDKDSLALPDASLRLIPSTEPSTSWLSPNVDAAMADVRCSFVGVSEQNFQMVKNSATALATAVDCVVCSFDELRVLLRASSDISHALQISSMEIEEQYASLKDNLQKTMMAPGFSDTTRKIQADLAKSMASAHLHLTALANWSEVATKRLNDLADLRISEARAMYVGGIRSERGKVVVGWVRNATQLLAASFFGGAVTTKEPVYAAGTAFSVVSWMGAELLSRRQASAANAQKNNLSEFVPDMVNPMNKMLHSVKFLRYRLSTLFNRMTYGYLTSKMARFSFVEAFEFWETTRKVWEVIRPELHQAKLLGDIREDDLMDD